MTQLTAFEGATPRNDRRALSSTKSALQKYIRRGETQKALAASTFLMRGLVGGRDALRKRLPIIAVEDVGWWWVPTVLAACGEPNDERVLDAVYALAESPKSKEAAWLSYLTDDTTPGDVQELVEALTHGDYVMATQQARSLMKITSRYRTTFGEIASDLPQLAAKELARGSIRILGGGPYIEAFGSFVIACIDHPTEVMGTITERPTVPLLPFPEPLEWYTQDQHTYYGKVALSIVAKRRPEIGQGLGALMFWFESTKLGPSTITDRWEEEFKTRAGRSEGWGSWENGAALWTNYRDDVRRAIEWLQRKHMEQGAFA